MYNGSSTKNTSVAEAEETRNWNWNWKEEDKLDKASGQFKEGAHRARLKRQVVRMMMKRRETRQGWKEL